MEKLFLLAGKARNGKDTVGEILKETYEQKGKKVLKLSYGVWPKYYGKLICHWDGNEETKPRSELQKISVESRHINPNYVVRRMEEDINILKDSFDVIIITDARMPEEVEMPKLKFKQTVTIKVERPNFVSPLSNKQQDSIIETALDNYDSYDYKIENSGTKDDLREKVQNLILLLESNV